MVLLYLLSGSVGAQLQPRWDSATSAEGQASQQLIQADARLAKIVSFANATYRLPRPVPLVYQETGKINAWYHGGDHQITVSYDLVSFLRKFYRAKKVAAPDQAACDTLVFILLHELGHAMIHELDLPVVGREENAADEFATLFSSAALGDGGRQSALVAAQWFRLMGGAQIKLDEMPFWDEHSLDSQRFFSILCLLYGADPQATSGVIAPLVPYTRLRTAEERHPLKAAAWSRLLSSHTIGVSPLPLHPVLPDPREPRSVHFQADPSGSSLLPISELQRIQQFQTVRSWLNRHYSPPKHLYARYLSTDVPVNVFLPLTGQLIMSRQFFDSAEQKLSGLPSEQKLETLRALETFSLLTEFSRGLIQDAQLPVTAEPEEAAAELTMLLILQNPEFRELAVPMSRWYQAMARETSSVLQLKYWSESALSQQRYYDLLGYLYVVDPQKYPQAGTMFDQRRLQKLQYEYYQKRRNWSRLLKPFEIRIEAGGQRQEART